MKLEVGMYVRTRWQMYKILEVSDLLNMAGTKIGYKYTVDKYGFLREADIIKASFNIIDLIEVGDYVNGSIVSETYKDKLVCNGGMRIIKKNQIKTIVTKEQFASMEYKLESDKGVN